MKKTKGFTLIEVMVVMAIIAVLAVLIIGAITLARRTATETTHRSNAKTIQTGMEAYYAKNKTYYVTGGSSCTTMSGAAILDVTLSTGSSSLGSCLAGAAATGGCAVVSTVSTYTITPWNYNCSAALGASDQLTVN